MIAITDNVLEFAVMGIGMVMFGMGVGLLACIPFIPR
jgi:hypothetical protein